MSEEQSSGMWLTLAIIFLGSLIDGLDVTIVTVSLPTIAQEFGVTMAQSSWIIFAYVLSIAAMLLAMGKMAKNGRVKKFMILGTALFGISSFLCGVSDSFEMLVTFRFIQGISAAMMSSVLPSIVVRLLPVDRKGLGLSIMGAASALSVMMGPIIGGVISDFLSWNWLFFINVPVCLVIILLAMKQLPKDEPVDRTRDPTVIGGVSAIVTIVSLLVLLQDLGDADMNNVARIACPITGIIGLSVLIWSIKRDTKRAIIAPKMIMNKEYLIVGAAFLLCTIVVSGAQYVLPYMLQKHWSLAPSETGLYLAIPSVAMLLLVIPVGKICDTRGCKMPSAMAAIVRGAFCAVMLYMTYSTQEPIFLLIPLLLFGASHAFSGTAQPTRMMHHATPGYQDEATNFMLVINYVASALGCVIFAMIMGLFSSGPIESMTDDELINGFRVTMMFSLIILAIALACTMSVRNKIVRKDDPIDGAAEASEPTEN